MSLESIMEEARKLSDAESRRLSAFLLSLRHEPQFAVEAGELMDDKDDSMPITAPLASQS